MHSQPEFNRNTYSEALFSTPISLQDIVARELSLIGTTADETLHMVSNVLQLLMRTGDPNTMTLHLSSSETLGFYNILSLANAAIEFEHDRIQSLDIEAV